MVQDGQLKPEAQGSTTCRSYSAPVQRQYLEGCVDECRSFETLQEAEDHCDRVADCGGVTHSLYGEGQAWHDGIGPYEVGWTILPSCHKYLQTLQEAEDHRDRAAGSGIFCT